MDKHEFVPQLGDTLYCDKCGQQANRPIHLVEVSDAV